MAACRLQWLCGATPSSEALDMGLVDRLNRWTVDRLPSWRKAIVVASMTDEDLKLSTRTQEEVVAWDDVSRVTAVLLMMGGRRTAACGGR